MSKVAIIQRIALAALAFVMYTPCEAQPFRAEFSEFRYVGLDPANAQSLPADNFRNPVLAGFRSDPAIVRVGKDFYLITSSFSYWPGLPIFHSRDLVSWTQVGSAIDRREQMNFDGLFPSLGLYGPDIKFYRGLYYALSTCLKCGGNFIVTASDPRGPWSQPHWLPFDGIDPGIFFDNGGLAYIVNSGPPVGKPQWPGHHAIWIQEIDLPSMTMKGERSVIVDGGTDPLAKPEWIEGPHLFKRDGYYYLIAAEGGTGARHSQVVFRSRSVTGPYVAGPSNPILTQRDLSAQVPGAVAAAGHADFVQLDNGTWWAVFLGVRPYNGKDYNTGRDTFLLPVKWNDGWPIVLPATSRIPRVLPRPHLPRQPSPAHPTSGDYTLVDRFSSSRLARYWSFLRTPREPWWRSGGGKLRITAQVHSLGELGQPSFLALRQAHPNAEITVNVRLDGAKNGDRAGLAAFMDERRWFAIVVVAGPEGREVQVERRQSASEALAGVVIAKASVPHKGTISVNIEVKGGLFSFSYRTQGNRWEPLGIPQDAALLSTDKAGGFTGVMLGPYAVQHKVQAWSLKRLWARIIGHDRLFSFNGSRIWAEHNDDRKCHQARPEDVSASRPISFIHCSIKPVERRHRSIVANWQLSSTNRTVSYWGLDHGRRPFVHLSL